MNTSETPTTSTTSSTPTKKPVSRRRLITLVTAGALAVGLTVGGVATAYATSHEQAPVAASSIVFVTPKPTPARSSDSGSHAASGSHAGGGSNSGGGSNGGGGNTPAPSSVSLGDLVPVVKSALGRSMYPDARYEPVPNTYLFTLGQLGGQSEQLIDAHGDAIAIGLAQGSFATQQAQIASTGTRLTGYGSAAVYQGHQGVGVGDIEIFANGYWVSLSSSMLTSPATAASVIQAVLQAMPQA